MSYNIKHMGLGGILDQAIQIVKDHFGLLFAIMLFLMIPFTLITGFITIAVTPELPANPSVEDYRRVQEAYAQHWPWMALFGVINMLFILPLTNAAVTFAVAKLYLGQPTTAIDSISNGFAKLIALILTSILMYLAIFGGLILLIIPGILFALWFGLALHVVIIEGISGAKALSRSKRLVRNHLGTFLMLGLVMFIISFAIGMISELIPQGHLSHILQVLLQAVITIFWTAAGVVFYFSCRCAEENFDLHYLAEAIGDEPESAGTFAPSSLPGDS